MNHNVDSNSEANHSENDISASEKDIEFFSENGYLLLTGFLDKEEVDIFRDEMNRILELVINSSIANNRTNKRLGLTEDENGSQSVRTIHPYIDLSQSFRSLAVDKNASIAGEVSGSELVLLDRESQLNFKQPLSDPIPELDSKKGDDRFPVHADSPYFDYDGVVVVSVFLDDCTVENGALEVWPGTHKEDIGHVQTELGLAASPDEVDYNAGNPITGPAGSVLIMDSQLIHSSGPNTTSQPRRMALYRYTPQENVETELREGAARLGYQSSFPMEFVESAYENEYLRMKRNNSFSDCFDADDHI